MSLCVIADANKSLPTFARMWHLVDARGQILGNLARGIATALAGQHKPVSTASQDGGDHVVVINTQDMVVSGDKMSQKLYFTHSGYPGGMKTRDMHAYMHGGKGDGANEVLRLAVYGMLPKDMLRRPRMLRLHMFKDDQHPYEQNIMKVHEQTVPVNPRQWFEMSPEQAQQHIDSYQQQRINALFQEFQKREQKPVPPIY